LVGRHRYLPGCGSDRDTDVHPDKHLHSDCDGHSELDTDIYSDADDDAH
jgi:hypothetical protein